MTPDASVDRLSRRRIVRLVGWAVAINSLVVLAVAATGGWARDAAGQFALWCGLG